MRGRIRLYVDGKYITQREYSDKINRRVIISKWINQFGTISVIISPYIVSYCFNKPFELTKYNAA